MTMTFTIPRKRPAGHSSSSCPACNDLVVQNQQEDISKKNLKNLKPYLHGRNVIFQKKPRIFLSCFAFYILFIGVSSLFFNTAELQRGNVGTSNIIDMVSSFLANSIRGRNSKSSTASSWYSIGSSSSSSSSSSKNYEDDSFSAAVYDERKDKDEYFSACILWMDDNHRLEEWLAYHYYFLKLRYVVINVDLRSATSPQAIVDRWNGNNKLYNNARTTTWPNNSSSSSSSSSISTLELDYDLNMTILLWNDTMYIDPIQYEFEQQRAHFVRGESRYKIANEYIKKRQSAFYQACTEHLISEREKEQKQESKNSNSNSSSTMDHHERASPSPSQWMAYFDTDEFFAFEPQAITYGRNRKSNINNNSNKYETPGYVLKRLNSIKKNQIRQEKWRKEYEPEKLSPSSSSSPSLSCLVIPRYGIGSMELTEEETNELLLLNTTIPAVGGEVSSSPGEALVPSEFVREILLPEQSKSNTNEKDTTTTTATNDGKTIVRRFDTLRYKHHVDGSPTLGKSILDLSKSDVREYTAKRYSPFKIHGVIESICKKNGANRKKGGNHLFQNYFRVDQEKMQLNHYVGSWESYNARPNDLRKGLNHSSSAKHWENSKSHQNWLQTSDKTSGKSSTVVRPWLKGFIRLVGGPKVAAHLLQDAGMISPQADNKEGVNHKDDE